MDRVDKKMLQLYWIWHDNMGKYSQVRKYKSFPLKNIKTVSCGRTKTRTREVVLMFSLNRLLAKMVLALALNSFPLKNPVHSCSPHTHMPPVCLVKHTCIMSLPFSECLCSSSDSSLTPILTDPWWPGCPKHISDMNTSIGRTTQRPHRRPSGAVDHYQR